MKEQPLNVDIKILPIALRFRSARIGGRDIANKLLQGLPITQRLEEKLRTQIAKATQVKDASRRIVFLFQIGLNTARRLPSFALTGRTKEPHGKKQ